jgi:hypothetical protein
VDLLVILQVIGMLLKTFANVLLAITLAVTAGAAVNLLWQWLAHKNDFCGDHQHDEA